MSLMDKLKLPEVRDTASLDDTALSLLHRRICFMWVFTRS
jgi:hypothetical protein